MNRSRQIAFWISVVLVLLNTLLVFIAPLPMLRAEALGRAGYCGIVALILWILDPERAA